MKWYAIANQTADSADVEIFDEIGGWGISAKEFIKDLKGLAGRHINVRINSPGGSIVDGQAIISALRRHNGGFTAWIEGLAASMASVIACAADRTYIADGGMLMIHRASTVSMGDADDLRKDADLLEKFERGLVSVYTTKTGRTIDEINDMLDKETWMDALEAVALGFCDGITENTPAMAKVSPEDLKRRFDNFAKGMTPDVTPSNEDTAPEVVVESAPEIIEEAVVETPAVAPSEPTALAKDITALVAQNKVLVAEVSALKESLELAKAAIGVLPARVEPVIKPSAEATSTILEKWDAISDPAEKDKFYKQHRNEILLAIKS